MKYLLILLCFISTIAVGQVELSFGYRFLYNSDMIFEEDVFNYQWQKFQTQETIIPLHQNSLIGVELFVPFSSFDENYSLLYSERFFFSASAHYLYDQPANEFDQQFYDFGLHFKLLKNDNIHLSSVIHVEEIFSGTELGVWTGHDVQLIASYNMVEQEYPNVVNFYGSMSYILFGEYMTLNPYGNQTVRTGDFQNIIGAVLNIKDIVFFEQAINVITELNNEGDFPFVTFSPYYSDFKFKTWVRIGKFDLDYTHVCFHPFESTNDNPRISGVLNSVGLTFNL